MAGVVMMAAIWPVNLTPADKAIVTELAQRRAALGLSSSYADTIRDSVRGMLALPDEDIVVLLERAREEQDRV
jgi:hypothetical protein